MEVIVLNGKEYLKASRAAEKAGYTSDYIGQLCRGGKIDAKLVGRTWYVNADDLEVHQSEKRRMSRSKAREQIRNSVARIQQDDTNPEFHYTKSLRYETDESELLPPVRKLPVLNEDQGSRESRGFPRDTKDSDPKVIIENEGNHVVMHGEITVKDAESEPLADEVDTVILSPKIQRRTDTTESRRKDAESSVFTRPGDQTSVSSPSVPGFIAKLESRDVQSTQISDVAHQSHLPVPSGRERTNLAVVLILVASSFFVGVVYTAKVQWSVKETDMGGYDLQTTVVFSNMSR